MLHSFKKFGVNVMGYRVNKESEGKRIITSKARWVFLLTSTSSIRDGRPKFKKIGKKKTNEYGLPLFLNNNNNKEKETVE